MLVLVLDTSTPAVTAALVQVGDGAAGDADARVLASRVTVDARAHAEVLTPQVQQCLVDARHTPAELDAVVCGTGPGPYTGLRVGMVTAAAWGDALGVPVHGVCSLDGIAGAANHDGPLLVVTDARRREVYWARYAARVRTDGPGVVKPADLDLAGATAVAGSAVHAALFGVAVQAPEHPDPAALVRAADLTVSPAPLVPLYLRRPDAVEPAAAQHIP